MSTATNSEPSARPAIGSAPLASSVHTRNKIIRTNIEKFFEALLWGSRYIVLIAVIGSLASAIASIYVATVDTVMHLRELSAYANSGQVPEEHDNLRASTVTHVVEAVDGYLLGIVMLIFAFGLYELFISRIDSAENDEKASRILLIHSLDDLKNRLAQVILLIMIVKFFERTLAKNLSFDKPLELVYLATGILMISGALYLVHKKDHPDDGFRKASAPK